MIIVTSSFSWLVRSTPERAVWVRALAGDIVCCVLGQAPAVKMVTGELDAGGNPAMD